MSQGNSTVYVLTDVRNYEPQILGVFDSLDAAYEKMENIHSLNMQVLEFDINQLQSGAIC